MFSPYIILSLSKPLCWGNGSCKSLGTLCRGFFLLLLASYCHSALARVTPGPQPFQRCPWPSMGHPKDAVPQEGPSSSIEHHFPEVHLYTWPQQCLFPHTSPIPFHFSLNTALHIPPHVSASECPPVSPVMYLFLASPAPSSCCPSSNMPEDKWSFLIPH